jgi:hypothetical protein
MGKGTGGGREFHTGAEARLFREFVIQGGKTFLEISLQEGQDPFGKRFSPPTVYRLFRAGRRAMKSEVSGHVMNSALKPSKLMQSVRHSLEVPYQIRIRNEQAVLPGLVGPVVFKIKKKLVSQISGVIEIGIRRAPAKAEILSLPH